MGEEMPGTTSTENVENRVDHLAVRGPRTPSPGFGENKGSDQFPLSIGQIRGVRPSL